MADTLQGLWMVKEPHKLSETIIEAYVATGDHSFYDIKYYVGDDSSTIETRLYLYNGGTMLGPHDIDNPSFEWSVVDGATTYYGASTITIMSTLSEVTDGDILLAWLKANAKRGPVDVTIKNSSATLATEGTYCDADIHLNMVLQEKTVAPIAGNYSTEVKADRGYVGLNRVLVDPIKTESRFVSVTSPDITAVTPTTSDTYLTQVVIEPVLQDKTVTPTTASQTVTADTGNAGLSSVTVNAAPLDEAQTVTAGTVAKTVSPTGSNIGIKSVTVNPTPSETKSVTLTVPGETVTVTPDSGKLLSSVSVSQNLQAKIVTPTTSQQVINPDSGFCGLGVVSIDPIPTETKTVTAGTSATTVTPTSGKFLTSVTVNPTPTQIKDITLTTVESTDILPDAGKFLSKVMVSPRLQNKTFYPAEQTEGGTVWADEGYAGLESVEITGIELEEKTATENGVVVPYAGRFLSKVTVNVPSIIDVATAAGMDAVLVEANVGKVYRFTGTTDENYTNGDLYEVVSE